MNPSSLDHDILSGKLSCISPDVALKWILPFKIFAVCEAKVVYCVAGLVLYGSFGCSKFHGKKKNP